MEKSQMPDNELPPEELELEAELDDEVAEDDAQNHEGDDDSQDQGDKTTEKRLKDTQAALTKANQKNAELEKKFSSELDTLKGQLSILLQQQQGKEQPKEQSPFDFLDNEEETRTLLDDPKNVASALKKTLGGIAETLDRRDKYMIGEIKKLISSSTSDESRAVAKQVEKLRQDSDYKDFPEENLRVIAKKQIAAAAKRNAGKKYAGTFGGGGGGRYQNTDNDDDGIEARARDMFKAMYPKDKFDDEKE